MASKIKKFKSKTRKGAKKRLKVSGASKDVKILSCRINTGHRLIPKTRERKLRDTNPTVLSKCHKKYLKSL